MTGSEPRRQARNLKDRLHLDDPDDVDKAEQVAWMKMQLEDRKFLKGGAGLHRIRPQRKPKMLLQNRKTRMLNRRRATFFKDNHTPTTVLLE